MDETRLLIMIFGPVIIMMFSIIAFFGKKILARLDDFQTVKGCSDRISTCRELTGIRRELGEKDRETLVNEIACLNESFDSLCRCLKTFTKGECP